jgi:hypothetical protein
MKGWEIERISDLALLKPGTGEEVYDDECVDDSIVIARNVSSEAFLKAIGDEEKLPCKFALIVCLLIFSRFFFYCFLLTFVIRMEML